MAQEWSLSSTTALWEVMSGGTARTRATIAAQTPSAQVCLPLLFFRRFDLGPMNVMFVLLDRRLKPLQR